MSYRIGSFNLGDFSNYADKDVRAVAGIITKAGFAVIALQGVLDAQTFSQIQSELPSDWRGCHAIPQTRTREFESAKDAAGNLTKKPVQNPAKGYAFFWDTRKMTLFGKPELVARIKQGAFIRNPYYARFIPSEGGPFCEFRLINVHLCNPAEGLPRQYQEYATALDVYAQISAMRYGDNRPAYTILLGDYQMSLVNCRKVERTKYLPNQLLLSDIKKNTVLADPQTLSKSPSKKDIAEKAAKAVFNIGTFVLSKGEVGVEDAIESGIALVGSVKNKIQNHMNAFTENYDHFSYDAERFTEILLGFERINAVKKYYRNDYIKYRKGVSDHVPIKMEVSLNGDIAL